MRRWMVAGLAVAAVGLAGCDDVTAGTPMADPDQTGISTPSTTSRSSPTTRPRAPDSSAPATPPAPGMASTTCGEYVTMDEETKRQVIVAIGQENELIGMNPELWKGMADMMCTFTDKSTPVKDAVTGEGFG